MAVVKVIEILSESEKSWEDATQEAVTEAAKSVRNIKSVWVHDMQAKVANNRIVQYRVNVKISFEVE